MMENKQVIEKCENSILHTYNRYQMAFDHGEGVYLYDIEGNKYLDFASGIGVMGLGYHYPGYDEALKAQIDKVTHVSNYFYNEPAAEAAEKLIKVSGMSKVFFTNSGTESAEGAIKTALKYAYAKDGKHDHEIIAMTDSFHGRSMGALSVTINEHYQEPFRPLMSGIKVAEFNNLESVKAQFNEHTCAVILEVVQGEGGINPADREFLEGVKELCDANDALLIFDEVQCGMGRTGDMFAWQGYGVKPNVMTCAKAIGCGVPVGAFFLDEKAAAGSLVAGDHGTTYGGNPLACAAISKVLDIFEDDKILDNVKEVGAYFTQKLDELVAEYDCIIERRGKGLMQGLEFKEDVKAGDIVLKAHAEGLIVITAEHNVLRMLPPLVITKENVDEMIGILKKVL